MTRFSTHTEFRTFALPAAVLSVALLATAGTHARPGMGGPGGMPTSIAEAEARHAAHIARLDTNQDGAVTLDEFQLPQHGDGRGPGPHGRRHRGERGDQTDNTNRLFERLDEDGDGALSPDEFAAARAQGRQLQRETVFARLDSDGDGRITTDDESPPVKRLKEIDTDQNGLISREERRAARQEYRANHAR